jgi:hypothetical protein
VNSVAIDTYFSTPPMAWLIICSIPKLAIAIAKANWDHVASRQAFSGSALSFRPGYLNFRFRKFVILVFRQFENVSF